MEPFATVADLELFWRPLSSDEQARADVLLDYASAKIRARVPNIDARIASGDLDPMLVEQVAVAMAKRAMISGGSGDGIIQTQQTAGPFSSNASYANPQGNLYLSADDLRDLGAGSGGKARSVQMGHGL